MWLFVVYWGGGKKSINVRIVICVLNDCRSIPLQKPFFNVSSAVHGSTVFFFFFKWVEVILSRIEFESHCNPKNQNLIKSLDTVVVVVVVVVQTGRKLMYFSGLLTKASSGSALGSTPKSKSLAPRPNAAPPSPARMGDDKRASAKLGPGGTVIRWEPVPSLPFRQLMKAVSFSVLISCKVG